MFQEMKTVLEGYVERYGKEHAPPPWQMFTISNSELVPGSMQMIQKVFEGPFEVSNKANVCGDGADRSKFDVIFNSGSNPNIVDGKF